MGKHIRKFYALFFISLLFFTSCATTLNVKVTRPARLNLNGAKTIGVLPFDKSDKNPFNYFFDGDEDIVTNYFNYYGKISKVEQDIINYLHDSLEEALMISPYISLISSRELKSALKYGGKNPADVFIGGEIVSFTVLDIQHKIKHKLSDEEFAKSNSKTPYYYDYEYSREVELIINYEIVDGKTRRIISHDTEHIHKSSGNYENVKELPSIYYMVSDDLDSFVYNLMTDIQPYTINKTITLLDDESENPLMEHADELANDGYYKESYSEYIKIYMHTKKFEAGYNAAMLLLAMGELHSSEALMNEIYKNHGDKRALDALYDIRNEITQAERLDNQINPISDEADYDVFTFDYDDFD